MDVTKTTEHVLKMANSSLNKKNDQNFQID
jgi:hypothetical protein